MRLTTVRRAGEEVVAVVLPTGALPLDAIPGEYPRDLLALLKSGRVNELGESVERLEDPADGVIPFSEIEYAPPYRHPPKLWGIGLNYAEHAGDLSVDAPADEPASFMRPATTIIGPGEAIRLPEQSRRVTGEAELGVVIGREAKTSPRGRRAG